MALYFECRINKKRECRINKKRTPSDCFFGGFAHSMQYLYFA